MKQLISLVLIFGLLTLAACGTKEEASSSASSEPSLSTPSSSASEQEKAPTPEELLKGVGETHLESSFFDFSLELSSGWRFLSSGELDTASSLAESQMEQKEIDLLLRPLGHFSERFAVKATVSGSVLTAERRKLFQSSPLQRRKTSHFSLYVGGFTPESGSPTVPVLHKSTRKTKQSAGKKFKKGTIPNLRTIPF